MHKCDWAIEVINGKTQNPIARRCKICKKVQWNENENISEWGKQCYLDSVRGRANVDFKNTI